MNDPVERIAESLERIAAAMEREAQLAGMPPPEALAKKDAARFLGVDEATIEQLIRTRRLAYVQHGSQRGRVIPVAALRAFLEEYRQESLLEVSHRGRR